MWSCKKLKKNIYREDSVNKYKHIYDACAKLQNAIGVFCDSSKIFDCVDFKTVLIKLYHYGIPTGYCPRPRCLILKNNLNVNINNVKSFWSSLRLGVPQESILGLLLFLLYITNFLISFLFIWSDIVLFADDTSLIIRVIRYKVTSIRTLLLQKFM